MTFHLSDRSLRTNFACEQECIKGAVCTSISVQSLTSCYESVGVIDWCRASYCQDKKGGEYKPAVSNSSLFCHKYSSANPILWNQEH